MMQQPVLGQAVLIIGASQSHSETQSVEPLWTSVQQDAQTSDNTLHLQVTYSPQRNSNPQSLQRVLPQIHALEPRWLWQAIIVLYGA